MIYKFENSILKNPFNPAYRYFIFEDNFKNKLKINNLKSFILKNEKKIIKKYQSDYDNFVKKSKWIDGETGLGKNSLTSRSPFYNLLNFKETNHLKKIIKESHNQFLSEINTTYSDNLYVQCWANVMRKNDKILKHSHANNNWDYLSGHICVSTKETYTHYVDPFYNTIFSSKNEIGKITIFPSWIKHYTDKVKSEEKRITIAFDIRNEEAYRVDVFDEKKYNWEEI
jgi:hypothetical protein